MYVENIVLVYNPLLILTRNVKGSKSKAYGLLTN